jgi:hypothetical protein
LYILDCNIASLLSILSSLVFASRLDSSSFHHSPLPSPRPRWSRPCYAHVRNNATACLPRLLVQPLPHSSRAFAAYLPRCCRKFAAHLLVICSIFTASLLQIYSTFAARLPLIYREFAATLPQVCSKFAVSLPHIYRKFTASCRVFAAYLP